jgi:hypothetical protein
VYVGDAALYELGVFIADEVRQRLRRNPEFVPPELRSVLAYDLRDVRGARMVVREGRTYEVHVFRRALFPVAPGRIVVPPARLSYAVPLGASFFSREETRLLYSESVTIVAIAPPAAGRPSSWSGAVGNLRISMTVSAGAMRVGDPFVATLRVSGEANVNLLPRPAFSLAWASVVPSAERVTIDTLAPTVRGAKEFDWLVTPTVDGREELPAVDYAYFDPSARQYRIARSTPKTISVGEGSLAALDTGNAVPARRGDVSLRTEWSRPLPDAPDRTLWYWLLGLLVPMPAIVRFARERPRKRARETPAGALAALAGEGVVDAAHVRGVLHAALDDRLGASSVAWADPVLVRRALRHRGITDATADNALSLLARMDAAAYGDAGHEIPGIATAALALYDKIDREARRVGPRSHALRSGVVVAVLLWGALLVAQYAFGPRALFERGLGAFAAGTPGAAATDFFSAARAEPGAVVAWLNAGTASWVANDTARAVVGWQRALRLDPLDGAARQYLTLVGADAGAGRDAVWPIPRRLPAWVALVLWISGWVAIWRTRRTVRAVTALAAAVILAVASRVQYARLTDPRAAVMASPAPLRILPALGAEAGATPLTGELMTVVERRGVWVHIVGSGDRAGWIDAARVVDLDGRPLRD